MSKWVNVAFDAAAETYRGMLGYAPGERLTSAEDVARVMRELAAAHSKSCGLEEYGRSVQGRPLQLLTVGSEANIKRLNAVRKANESVTARDYPQGHPVTVW